ncbi:MAG: hypothetical protein Q8L48_32410 [Archangium sp.]|nr:hypothetical protein [Archangium sp.]
MIQLFGAFTALLLFGAAEPGPGADAGAGDRRAEQVLALIEGTLDVGVQPVSLFDVSPGDERAAEVERARLRLVLGSDAGRPPQTATFAADAWSARDQLDRARLAFYELSAAQRSALLETHARRQRGQDQRETEAERAAAAARLELLEADRVAADELTRQAAALATARLSFEALRLELAARREVVVGWQRRLRTLRADPLTTADDIDATYDALRGPLKAARDALQLALDDADRRESILPPPLVDGGGGQASPELAARRAAANQALRDAGEEERALREHHELELLEEINALNRERLSLLPLLSDSTREATTGFTLTALDQARTEVRHLLLTLRTHWQVIRRWAGDVSREGGVGGLAVWRLLEVLVPSALLTLGFVWWRRRSPGLLTLLESREVRAQRGRGRQRGRPSVDHPRRRALGFVRDVHRPLEELLFFAGLVWLLPDSARGLLEVRLLAVVIGWWLVASLVIDATNALATWEKGRVGATTPTGALRLRSLRLVGRVVVGFGLALVLCSRLVGEGTVFRWVLVACWLAVVPVFLLLVRWWREPVFLRLERLRRHTPLQAWVLQNRHGWKSFFAAMVAAVHLFLQGLLRRVSQWVSGFELARRAHAWLFRRELARLAEEKPARRGEALPEATFAALSPLQPSQKWIRCPADEHLDDLRARATRGGVVAVVGPSGQGKSSLLRRLATAIEGAVLVQARVLLADDVEVQALSEPPEGGARPPLVLVDDLEVLIKPVRGGLAQFDQVISLARGASAHTLWVFAVDEVVWPFLQRACEGRPLFDEVLTLEPWSDEEIGALLEQRSAEAGIDPVFDDLLEGLPAAADEIDRLDALAARRAGYFRMTWDHARGNPAMALEAWRASLCQGATGEVRVRALTGPDSTALDALSDSALFVVRAVLQLTPAAVADLVAATRLSVVAVENTVRFGEAMGFFVTEQGRVRVASPWLRSVMVLLERRHLLVSQ